jgi:hypothetical protein
MSERDNQYKPETRSWRDRLCSFLEWERREFARLIGQAEPRHKSSGRRPEPDRDKV